MKRLAVLLAAVVLSTLPVTTVGAAPPEHPRGPQRVPGRYIVTFEDSIDRPGAATKNLERAHGFQARFTYSEAVKGFAASLNRGQVRALQNNTHVDFITPDLEVEATGSVPLAEGDLAPTGVRRIEAATTSTTREASSVNVAVLDSGIALTHSDLNAVHGKNCMGTGQAIDDNGHGTHVAGTIAAKNDGAGVVGVAPGTKLYSVKVLDANGDGTVSSVMCGIDWVTSTRTDEDASNDIAVANMSLGGPGNPVRTCATTTDAEHLAICRSTAAGVTYVVAAGNDEWDFDYATVPDTPAAFPEVLTVTAMTDGNGSPGGSTGIGCDPDATDEMYAGFSNFAATTRGAAHTIAAPGTCIQSTTRGGGYGTMSGTSMATPHVAGAVALCLEEAGVAGPCSGMTPAEIIEKMRADAAARAASYGFIGDPDHAVTFPPDYNFVYFGHLVWAGVAASEGPTDPEPPADTTLPTVTANTPANATPGFATSGDVISVTFSEEMDVAATEGAFSLVETADGSPVAGTFSWSGTTMRFVPNGALQEGTQYTASVTVSATDAAGNPLVDGRSWGFKTIADVQVAPNSVSIVKGARRAGNVGRLAAYDFSYFEVSSTNRNVPRSSWYGTFSEVPNSLRDLEVTYGGKASRRCNQTISIYRWGSSSWVDVATSAAGTSPTIVKEPIAGKPGAFVSGASSSGELRVRVTCEGRRSFYTSSDALGISYGIP